MSNRLNNETSPYLLAHAENPVNWYPWGDEAFEAAKREDKPIFLSIGYSTCHWCHVMAHESFEDNLIAEILNRYFIAIKVDKEERPDIDHVYMSVCQALTGQGGWPLSIFMDAEQKPFYAGTYFPKEDQYGVYGLKRILLTVSQKWEEERTTLLGAGEQVTQALREQRSESTEDTISLGEISRRTFHLLLHNFDDTNGGFTKQPKFPTPHNLMFLMRYAKLGGQPQAMSFVEKTLVQMYRGGIYDHIGYGFSRYSTDEGWLIPHFEKMLYDNALLLMTYAEAYQFTKLDFYRNVALEIMTYIKREMTDPSGGFYSAQDADSEGVEGKYYVFTPDETVNVLGEEQGKIFNDNFDITQEGNFEGNSIPNLLKNDSIMNLPDNISALKQKLYEYRLKRTILNKDDKILTAWNAMMIAALAKASRCILAPDALKSAYDCLSFLETSMATDEDGHLFGSHRNGVSKGNATLDDYTYLLWAYLELYQTDFNPSHLIKARRLIDLIRNEFFDENEGGCYLYSETSEQLIIRPKDLYDGSMPSGNSVFTYCLVVYQKLTAEILPNDLLAKQLDYTVRNTQDYSLANTFSMCACLLEASASKELVAVIKDREDLSKLISAWYTDFRPDLFVLAKSDTWNELLSEAAPFTKAYPIDPKSSCYYLCENTSCTEPLDSLDAVFAKIDS